MSRNNRVCVDHRMRPTDPHKPTSALEGRQRVSTRVVRFGEYLCGDEKGADAPRPSLAAVFDLPPCSS